MDKERIGVISELDECFETGVIIDGTGADLDEVDRIMRGYFELTDS